jgi:hypothetical protein
MDRLASALDRRDEAPNVELAEEISRKGDRKAVAELVRNLGNKDQNIRNDCIRVLYEVGQRDPKMISEFAGEFGRLLESKDNRMVWGAMTALDAICGVAPEDVFELLPRVVATADAGSVITRDHAVGILAKLAGHDKYAGKCAPLLLRQLEACPDNQLPMYAEKSLPSLKLSNGAGFSKVLTKRLKGLRKASQKRRVQNVLDSLQR